MSESMLEPTASLVVVLALCMTGITHLGSGFVLYGLQAALLGCLSAWIGADRSEPALVVIGIAVAVLKGIGVPLFLARTVTRIGVHRDVGLGIAPPLQLACAVGSLALLVLVRPLSHEVPLSAMPAIGLLLLGMLQMLTRRLAVSQILGFLVLENGIFLYTIAQPHSMPFVVEMGALMDVLVGTMMAGMLVFQIKQSFEHIDVAQLRDLRG